MPPSLPATEAPGRPPFLAGRNRRLRRAEATEAIEAVAAGIFGFEHFVDSLDFLKPEEAHRLKLAGGEIFDNIIRHAAPLDYDMIILRCARRGPSGRLYLSFYFRSPSFARFAAISPCGRVECQDEVPPGASLLDAETSPFFDPLIGRWRGIGLRMCRNLASSLLLRAGSHQDRIFLAF